MTQTAFKFVSKPSVDFPALCGLLYEATGEKVASFSDSHSPKLTPDRKLATCLESFIGVEPLTFQPLVASHLFFSGVVVCSELDVAEVMMCASELVALSSPSKVRGLSVVILSGSLNSWRLAVMSGRENQHVKRIFEQMLQAFTTEGYATIFSNTNRGMIPR